MKKAVRRAFYALAAMLALLAYALHDMIARSEATIGSHERRIAEEFASLRQGYAARQSQALLWAGYAEIEMERRKDAQAFVPSKEGIDWLRDPIQDGRYFPYEDLSEFRDYGHLIDLYESDPMILAHGTPESALITLAVAEELMFAGGLTRVDWRHWVEQRAFIAWNHALSERGLTGPEARRYARLLDYLERRRPSLREALRTQSAMDRLRVTRVLRNRSDPDRALTQRPSWRSLFLWRILIAQALTSLEQTYKDLEDFEELPLKQKVAQAEVLWKKLHAAKGVHPVPSSFQTLARFYVEEGAILHSWAQLRAALAVAWYVGERGHFPPSPNELAPEYLTEVPPDLNYRSPENETAQILVYGDDWNWKIRVLR